MNNYFILCYLLFITTATFSQSTTDLNTIKNDTLILTLDEAIDIAKSHSLDALVAKDQMKIAYWEYKNFKTDLLPTLTFEGSAPNFNTSISSYLKEDGSYDFVKSSTFSMQGGLFLNQNIPFTGGRISVESQAQFLEELNGNKNKRWLTIPVQFAYEQPLITARPMQWAKKIEPKKYKEAKQQFSVDMETIAIRTIQYYFDLLLTSVNNTIAQQNYENSIQLYEIAKAKKERGLLSDNDLMQLELNKLNAEADITIRRQDFDRKMSSFKTYLNIYDQTTIILPVIPEEFPAINLSINEIRIYANRNNPLISNIEWRLIETQKIIAEAKVNRGFQLNLFASVGFTGTDRNFATAFRNVENRQITSIGIRIPILDWNKGKRKVLLAKSQAKVETNRLEQRIVNFEEDILLTYNSYMDQNQLTMIARNANKVAQKRYHTVFETFILGQISVLDINTAQTEQESARRNYVNQLYASWLYYYSIRQITLFDFIKNHPISYDYENLK